MVKLKDRYAAALFELSLESGMPQQYMEQAAFVHDILKTDRCEDFLLHPHIPDTAKHEFLDSLFADKISADLMGFLYLAVEKSRESTILPALESYLDTASRHGGKVTANVVSAAPLKEKQVSALRAKLSEKLAKQVEIQTQTDTALIGGLYIHVEGRLIDLTVRTQLNYMKESLKRGGAE